MQRMRCRGSCCVGVKSELVVAERSGMWDIHVEEDAGSFSHHLSKDTRTIVLEVELALRDCFGWDDMTG